MESKTKNKQSEGTLIKIMETVFPNTSISNITELKDGFFNVAYQITLSNGKETILKIAPPSDAEIMSYEVDLMKTEIESMGLVREKTIVPVPEIFYYDNSHSVCNADYFVMEKLYGVTYNTVRDSFPAEKQYNIDYQLGQYNKRINSLTNDTFGIYSDKNFHSTDWKTVFLSMINSVLGDAIKAKSDLGFDYDVILNLVEKYSYTLEEVKEPKLIHWDLWEGNIFLEEGKINGIIDFERAMWADPLIEYHFRYHVNSPGYLDGYGAYADDENAKIRRYLYDIYLYTILVTECDYRHYSEDWQRNWAKGLLKEVVQKLL